ncbi:MAG: right-handed parallel beta-helix repeat-containing protein [Euryarchaeota archaeon]|nr:right-handed parallel beta-helix repeat-containing protein [Euryarchaeota archaeon]
MLGKWAAVSVGLVVLLSAMVVGSWQTNGTASRPAVPLNYTAHAPIRINSDAEFATKAASEGWNGSGAQGDPYIIESYDINGTSYGYCIYIGNTTDYFVVSNSYLHEASGVSSYPYYCEAGLILYNVQNGTIANNNASSNNGYGIFLNFYSNYNTIVNNTASSNNGYGGIFLNFVSNYNTIANNTASSNNGWGIFLDSSSSNAVANNTASSNNLGGIFISYSSSNAIANNTMADDGIFIRGDLLEHWNTHTIDTSNTVNGKPVQYWENQTSGSVPTGAGQVILANCTNVVVENHNVSKGTVGIELGFSTSNIITNNTAFSNDEDGIYVCNSSSNTIVNNTASSNNQYGIYLDGTSSNTIYHNNIIDNFIQAFDNGMNSWDNGYPSGGNFWSNYTGVDVMSGPNQNVPGADGIGDTPFIIDADSRDNYPLMAPFNGSVLAPPAWNWSVPVDYTSNGPGIGDLDGDGFAEVLFCSNCGVHCLDRYGSWLWNYNGTADFRESLPVVANLYQDGSAEVLVGSLNGSLYCFDSLGNLAWSSDYIGEWLTSAPGVADIDANGALEIIMASDNGTYCLDAFGNLTWSVPYNVSFATSPSNTPAIDDLDGDGLMEIVYATSNNYISCINCTGNEMWGVYCGDPYSANSSPASPAVADINADGLKEILVNCEDFLVCYDKNGSELWRFNCSVSTTSSSDTGPTVADLDLDGNYEILFGIPEGHFYCINHTGQLLWEKNYTVYSWSPGVGDFSGSPDLEVLVSFDGIRCLDKDGNELWYNNTDWVLGAVSGDIDRDGGVELLVRFQGNMTCIKTPGASPDGYLEWPFFKNGLTHPGRYSNITSQSQNDLSIVPTDISFSIPAPHKWDEVTITATIRSNVPVTNLPPSSAVDASAPYWKASSPITINATASDPDGNVSSVDLWFRWSSNNASWGAWTLFGNDTAFPWSWSFNFTSGQGFYQFYSIAEDNLGATESAPGAPDALCGYDSTPGSQTLSAGPGFWKGANITVNASASDAVSGVASVELWYRYSANNATWGSWALVGADSAPPYQWNLTLGFGYYQFYTRVRDLAGNYEPVPGGPELWIGIDTAFPVSAVDAISPYVQPNAPIIVTATASDTGASGLAGVEMWYRNSTDNSTWGAWSLFGTDSAAPYSWSFTFPAGAAYYEFYSRARDNAGNYEPAPGSADTRCYYNPPAPSITVSKIVDKATANPGDNLTYTIYFDNTGGAIASDVFVNDTLPAGVTYISDTSASLPEFSSRVINGAECYFSFVNVAPGAHSFTLMASINSTVANGTNLTNYVSCEYYPSGTLTEAWASTTIGGVLVPRPPIRINSNSDFDAAHGVSSGNGSQANPYIIENWDINGGGYGYCVYVGNTTMYFTVRNCYLHNASGVSLWPYYYGQGIILYNIQNGTINNNNASSNANIGIHLDHSDGNTISNNNATLNGGYDWGGILLYMSNGTTVTGNSVCSNTGPCSSGINVTYSNNNIIAYNRASSNAGLEGRGIILLGSDNNTVANNTLSLNVYGCWLIYGCDSNTLRNNSLSQNTYGCSIIAGTVNVLYYNNFINNTYQQAFDTGNSNYWNASYPTGGNYWSNYTGVDVMSGPNQDIPGADGIGDTPFIIDADSQDMYPLMSPINLSAGSDYSICSTPTNPVPFSSPGPVVLAANGSNCTVSFYLDSVSETNLIYREYGVFVPAGGWANVSAGWFVTSDGNHTIIVNITDSDPAEADLSNNQASKDVYVTPPCGKLKVKASSDKQKYVSGVDTHADIIVKVTYLGQLVGGANVSAWTLSPNGTNSSVAMAEASPGIWVGAYPFTNESVPGTYRIKAVATKAGFIDGANDDSKDKFFLDSPNAVQSVTVTPPISQSADTLLIEVSGNGSVNKAVLRGAVINCSYSLPLFDDGTHGDALPSDGIFSNQIDASLLRSSDYVVDAVTADGAFPAKGSFAVVPPDLLMRDVIGFSSSGGSALLCSGTTNITMDFDFAADIANASIAIFEHRTSSEGKYYNIIPDPMVSAAMTKARLNITYIESDVPAGVPEEDMLINVYDPYLGGYQALTPGGCDAPKDVVWGDTEHFSRFLVNRVPVRFKIPVVAGWNLVSVPLQMNATSLPTALLDSDGDTLWDRIQWYDPLDPANRWKQYYTGWASPLNDLGAVNHTMGVWIYVTAAGDGFVNVGGLIPNSTSMPLRAGWNLVGYPTLNATVAAADAFWGTGATMIEVFDPSAPYRTKVVGPTYIMKPGEGYWVYVPAPSTWTVDW